uniref:Macaca fascicularis brain cDNA clone: QmoA-11190, similar to human sideroflexin 1 (SFXN1), mRNA, RefSeq: NM_022754.4 n=1 Tax=Macaca fascicularis TaxID=9541 RepID=I7GP85_MACFA|nr:unnamed protein product [Macaca fascicularis]
MRVTGRNVLYTILSTAVFSKGRNILATICIFVRGLLDDKICVIFPDIPLIYNFFIWQVEELFLEIVLEFNQQCFYFA